VALWRGDQRAESPWGLRAAGDLPSECVGLWVLPAPGGLCAEWLGRPQRAPPGTRGVHRGAEGAQEHAGGEAEIPRAVLHGGAPVRGLEDASGTPAVFRSNPRARRCPGGADGARPQPSNARQASNPGRATPAKLRKNRLLKAETPRKGGRGDGRVSPFRPLRGGRGGRGSGRASRPNHGAHPFVIAPRTTEFDATPPTWPGGMPTSSWAWIPAASH